MDLIEDFFAFLTATEEEDRLTCPACGAQMEREGETCVECGEEE